jgi:hypothetical protein
MLDAALAAFSQLEFIAAPTAESMEFHELEILRSTDECLAVWSVSAPTYLDITEPRSGVEILRKVDTSWRFASAWQLREDLWEPDCESQLAPLP